MKYRDTTKYDRQRGWFLPDDYLDHGEHPADAATRILREQIGLSAHDLRLFEVESFGGEKTAWHLVFHYHAVLDEIPALAPTENVAEAEWFALDELPDPRDVAHHGWALDVLGRLATFATA